VLFTRSSKKFRILRYKNVKKLAVNNKRAYFWGGKKPIAVLKKEKSDTASEHRRPQKRRKVDFDFRRLFFDFRVRLLVDAVQKFERLIVQNSSEY
jgi:hypothetical protein